MKWKFNLPIGRREELIMYSILVCDDEKDIVSALEIYLKGEGYDVVTAYNGEEALKQLKEKEIHLVLLDYMMPVMDGLEATRQIRILNRKDTKEIPIIAMTANAFEEDRKACLDAGMNEHIGKPIDIPLLKRTITKAIGDR